MQIRGMARTVFIVRDFEASLAFYRDRLGLPLIGSPEAGWACFDVKGQQLCLCAWSSAMPYEEHSLGNSPDQLLLLVDDIEQARDELLSSGLDVRPVQRMSDSVRIAEFRDPDGRYLGLEERG
ncbi:MAG: VOC family protein [bacterium]